MAASSPSPNSPSTVDAVVVGAGFGGMYAVHKLRALGLNVQCIESGDDVGGTWYWNRYPGARCDVESMEYSYGFDDELQQEWEWSERYARQPEILRYASHVADRFDLREHIMFKTLVTSARFDEANNLWDVVTDSGETFTTQYLILATGMLSSANKPSFDGLELFRGEVHHTGQWPHDGVDFAGKRVGIIGTGSSGIQAIPVIASEAEHLAVFQRTPNYSIPAHNRKLLPSEVAAIKSSYADFRNANRQQSAGFGSARPRGNVGALQVSSDERTAEYERRWSIGGFDFLRGYIDLLVNPDSNKTAADFARRKIAQVVSDPETAKLLSPSQVIGCKRLCVDTNYFETYNLPNVELIDISQAPLSFSETGVLVGDQLTKLDCVVMATGFDAMTGSISKIDIRGRDGITMNDKWSAGPVNYLGLTVVGFPNLFTITGPGSPSVLTNMIVAIEQHVEWIADAVQAQAEEGFRTLEASETAESAWVGHVNSVADATLFPTCNSWYVGANVPGKPRVFMPLIGFPDYAKECERVASAGYEGFIRS